MAKKRTIYRDSKTGRFVSKSTWKRSRNAGGVRYKRERTNVGKPKKPRHFPTPRVPTTAPPAVFEWIVTIFPSGDNSPRNFDVIVTATDETEAVQVSKQFLRDDSSTRRIINAGNWTAVPARGNRTNEESGRAEYRGKSKN